MIAQICSLSTFSYLCYILLEQGVLHLYSDGNRFQTAPNQRRESDRKRHIIWYGLLEWIEKSKKSNVPQKVTRYIPCHVSVNTIDYEPELKAGNWPSKLILQLIPKQLVGNVGEVYLKNSKSVLFHPQSCEALDLLTNLMSSGFAGCVHFTNIPNPNACDSKILILLYAADKRTYLGLIPNEQAALVDRLRRIIEQQKLQNFAIYRSEIN